MASVADAIGKLLLRAAGALLDAVTTRAADAIADRRDTAPGAPPPSAATAPARVARLRPVRQPRGHHVWMSYDDAGHLIVPPVCENCDGLQTADSRFAPCPGRPVARYF